ncbi:hypothetical protein QYE76_064421 [Lolium multiflorum]|uniref:Uncharacterized protein n=1 Tax=Lolium multiflorum TaxID=4521 RepID=A0AAD8S864_LOLMU|nr:hypothetical protein QYE76_064421 [Lolium multiflorum]
MRQVEKWRSGLPEPDVHLDEWIMLHHALPHVAEFTFLQLGTSRYVTIDLSEVHTRYYFVGFCRGVIVLAQKTPHKIRLLNPLTKKYTMFEAQMPSVFLKSVDVIKSLTMVFVTAHYPSEIGWVDESTPTKDIDKDTFETYQWSPEVVVVVVVAGEGGGGRRRRREEEEVVVVVVVEKKEEVVVGGEVRKMEKWSSRRFGAGQIQNFRAKLAHGYLCIACSDEEAAGAAELMECPLAPFPVKYLGIPLSTRWLTAASFQPLVDRLAHKLPTWRASMMPRAGRLALIRAVLTAIPLHQLMVLSLNKKTLKWVNKILRRFLWAGRAEANGGHCHVNWSRVCRPQCLGGVGIPDLARTAIILRVRWIWRMRTDPLRPWRGLDMQFSKAELDILAASTSMVLGNGESALFWEDRWLDGKSVKEMAPEHTRWYLNTAGRRVRSTALGFPT